MPNNLLEKVIYISNEDYETLVSAGTVTIGGKTLTYDENIVYITPEKAATIAEDGLMSAEDKAKLDAIERGAQVNVQADWNQTDASAGDYIKNKLQVDAEFSLTSANPVQNKVISERLKDISNTLTHIKYKLFGATVLSEIDHKVDYATIYPIPETLSDDDGTHRVVYSDTQLKEIEGNSFVYTQKLHNESTSSTTEGHEFGNNASFSIENGKMRITSTGAPQAYFGVGFGNLSSLQNHRVLCLAYVSAISLANSFSDISFNWGLTNLTDVKKTTTPNSLVYGIGTWGSAQTSTFLNVNQGTPVQGDYFDIERYMIFDLTQSGIDFVTTFEEAKTELLKRGINVDEYNEFNAGELKNTVIKGVKVNGYNLFDGELRKGYYVNGNYSSPGAPSICNKNVIKVSPNKTYKLERNTTLIPSVDEMAVAEYDKNMSFIKKTGVNTATLTVTLTSKTEYCSWWIYRSGMFDTLPSQSEAQVCFHLAGSRTGYASYKEPRIITIPQTELLSAGSAHDTVKIVEGNIIEGEQRYDMVRVSRVGSDDLGDLNYAKVQTANGYCFYGALPTSKLVDVSVVANLLCQKYSADTYGNVYNNTNDKTIARQSDGNNIVIYDSAYQNATATDVKTAMSGIILNYEKNEYTETTLATDLTFEEVSAIIEQGGSIEALFENVPPNLKTAFVVNKVIVS